MYNLLCKYIQPKKINPRKFSKDLSPSFELLTIMFLVTCDDFYQPINYIVGKILSRYYGQGIVLGNKGAVVRKAHSQPAITGVMHHTTPAI